MNHENKKHGPAVKCYSCPKCEAVTDEPDPLLRHMKSDHDCYVCWDNTCSFTNPKMMAVFGHYCTNHVRKAGTEQVGWPWYMCVGCYRLANNSRDARMCFIGHRLSGQYTCEECHSVLFGPERWKEHTRIGCEAWPSFFKAVLRANREAYPGSFVSAMLIGREQIDTVTLQAIEASQTTDGDTSTGDSQDAAVTENLDEATIRTKVRPRMERLTDTTWYDMNRQTGVVIGAARPSGAGGGPPAKQPRLEQPPIQTEAASAVENTEDGAIGNNDGESEADGRSDNTSELSTNNRSEVKTEIEGSGESPAVVKQEDEEPPSASDVKTEAE